MLCVTYSCWTGKEYATSYIMVQGVQWFQPYYNFMNRGGWTRNTWKLFDVPFLNKPFYWRNVYLSGIFEKFLHFHCRPSNIYAILPFSRNTKATRNTSLWDSRQNNENKLMIWLDFHSWYYIFIHNELIFYIFRF